MKPGRKLKENRAQLPRRAQWLEHSSKRLERLSAWCDWRSLLVRMLPRQLANRLHIKGAVAGCALGLELELARWLPGRESGIDLDQ